VLTEIEQLNLSDTQFTDADIVRLNELGELRILILSHTNVSNDSLDEIVRFRKLEFLNLTGTRVTPNRIAELRETMKPCVVLYDVEKSPIEKQR